MADRAQTRVVGIHHAGPEIYVQDYFQFFVHDGRPALFPIVHPNETNLNASGDFPYEQITTDALLNQLHLVQPFVTVEGHRGAPITMGGNIEALPGNVVVVGNPGRDTPYAKDNLVSSTHAAQLDLIAKLGFDHVELDTRFTPVGHADEIFSVIKSNSPCGFSVMVPAPKLALRLLAGIAVAAAPRCLRAKKDAPASFGRDDAAITRHMLDGCVGFRGETARGFLLKKNQVALNERLDDVVQNNKRVIAKAVAGLCASVDFVELPYLVAKVDGAIESVNPNPVNALIITPNAGNSIYLNNPSFVPAFDRLVGAALEKRGVRREFSLDPIYFEGEGGLHCASNTIQRCQF